MKRLTIGLVLWAAVGVSLYLTYQQRKAAPPEESPAPEIGAATVSIPTPAMTLADFSLTNSRGETVTKADVVGSPTVWAFVFTRCQSTCPPIMLEMKKLHDEFADTDIRFVSVSVDPDYDTVEHLAKWFDIYDPDPERWDFLTGTKQTIHDMIIGGFQLQLKEMFGEDVRPGYEVTHTNRVVLVNPEGIPVKSFLILNDGDRAKLIRILKGKDEFPQPAGGTGPVTMKRGDSESVDLSADTP